MEELPRGEETSGVTPEGDEVLGANGGGRGGYRNTPATRDTEVSRDISSGKEMESGPGMAAPQCQQRGMSEGGGSELSMHGHTNGADGAKPKHVALARREYGLLAPEKPAGDPAAIEPRDCRDDPKATMETGDEGIERWRKETRTGSARSSCAASQRTLMRIEDPPNGIARLTNASIKGGRGGTPLLAVCASCAQPGQGGGYPDQDARSPNAQL